MAVREDKASNIFEWNYPADKGISQIIKEKGMKQAHVAEKIGCTPHELCDMLHGRKLIKACDILKLSIALGVTVGDIYVAGTANK